MTLPFQNYTLHLTSSSILSFIHDFAVDLFVFQSPNGFFLKSNFEYLRQNYRKSIKLLNSTPKTGDDVLKTGESLSTMYFNNLGCIHYQMHKYNLAAFYSRLALEENDKALLSLPPSEKSEIS